MENRPRYPESNGPRFTEHLNSSPPYHQYLPDVYPDSPEVSEYDAGPTGLRGPSPVHKERSTSPEVVSPGLHSIMDDESHKEVVPPWQWSQQHPDMPPGTLNYGEDERTGRTYCGLSRMRFSVLLAVLIIVVLGVALGAGLGVGLSQKNSSSTTSSSSNGEIHNINYLIGGAIDPKYYTNTGAFNGSGIALASQSFSKTLLQGTQGSIVMYFQHHTGEIRWIQLTATGEWSGGTPSQIVAVDARNSTPLSAVSYSIDGVNTWHVFYINKENILKQRTNSNMTGIWEDGPINDLKLHPYHAEQVGMQACWYGNDYGDSDYKHSPLPGQNATNGNAKFSNQVGMHMWYASDRTTFQQYGWRDGDDSWSHENSFKNMNGHAGVGCYSWGPGTVTYVMMANEENTVEFYWRDTNTNITSTKAHPINEWVKSSIEIKDANPATSLGYTNYFYAQLDDDFIHGYNISWAAEHSRILPNSEFIVGDRKGLPGTHLSVSTLPNTGGGNTLIVFYQTEGSDIHEYTRDWIVGQWSTVNIPIPNQ